MSEYSLGIDIGGTFTDLVIHDHHSGRRWGSKVLTTHADPQPTGNLLNSGVPDPVAQQLNGIAPPVTAGISFDAQSAQDTRNAFGFAFVPPDTNGAPGFNQYVQMVNVTIAVYDKRTGALLMTPAPI